MRKITTLAAVLSAAFCVGHANAAFITLDNFSLPAPAQFINDAPGGGATSSAPQVAAPSGVTRTFSHNLLLGPGGAGNYVGIGSTTFPSGTLEVSNTSGHNSEVQVSWAMPANYLGASTIASFGLWLNATDGNPTNVALAIGATNLGMINLPTSVSSAAGVLQLFPALDIAQRAALNAGGMMTMTINGADGWDLAIDAAGFQIPEPSSLALVGLALVGAGLSTRRRAA